MLKYQLNTNSIKNDIQEISVSSFETMDVPFVEDGKTMLTCYINERGLVHENDTILVVYDTIVPGGYDKHNASKIEEYVVDTVNEDNLSFTILYDKFIEMDASFARTESYRQYNSDGTYEDVEYVIVFFSTYHHFNIGDYVTVYLSDNVTNATTQLIKMHGTVVDNYSIRFAKKENMSAYKRIFYTEEEIQRNYALLTYFKLMRENFAFKFDDDGYLPNTTFYLQKVLTSISIPLTNTFSTELFNSINVDGFVQQQVDNSLNKYAENEKDIYYPISGDFSTIIRRIKFNFHFRQRNIDSINGVWAVDKNLSWNGVEINPNYGNENSSNSSKKTKLPTDFFSYSIEENQSDLLCYLDFSDSDVKYRKNVLKKSFVRLLFYDSTSPLKQRLLAYSTIFFDTGTLLNRYMRNINEDMLGCGYIVYSNKDDGKVSEDKLNGIRVNRELKVEKRIDEDKIEECRLSSQMVVTDKFISNNSSEGFYLYLWKDNVTESALDIYMRVEFNHAKYGRIIPFTMPYSNGSITSFQKIAEECTHIENGVLINDGFSLEDYRRYSYIHFKYLKSDEHGYVYYLDPNTYGSKAGVDGDSLILNLYEANVV